MLEHCFVIDYHCVLSREVPQVGIGDGVGPFETYDNGALDASF